MISSKIISMLLEETLPSYQATSKQDQNIGFGYLFYGLARTLRPRNVVVIGSKAGFSPLCFALGVAENNGSGISNVECYNTLTESRKQGGIYFVDPSYSADRNDENHWYGIGTWDDANETFQRWQRFGVEDIVKHYKLKSEEFVLHQDCPGDIDIVYIDGDHSFDGVIHDINAFAPLLSPRGVMVAHDVDPKLKEHYPEVGGFEAIESLPRDKWEVFRLPIYPGLAFLRLR